MSSYDPPADAGGIITQAEMRESMKLVRLQITTPLSLLMSIGANLVCALAIKPGLAEISKKYPTLISPNPILLALYWIVLYTLQVGFCLILVLARKEETKATLIHGVGMRFAIANWLMASWAVAWTLQFFLVSEIIVLVNVLILLSILITLFPHPQSTHRPLDSIFIHAPLTLMFLILFSLDWLHNGFIVLKWFSFPDDPSQFKYTWQSILSLLIVNLLVAVWIGIKLDVYATIGSEWILLTVLLSRQDKPTGLVVLLVVLMVVHPLVLLASTAWKRTRDREGRIRLEEEAEGAGRVDAIEGGGHA